MRWLGDDTPLGWTITLAYLAGSLAVLDAARRAEARSALRRVLTLLGGGLLALGVNKQLDLQTLVFRAGRDTTIALGLWDDRDALHLVFPALVGVALLIGLALLWRSLSGRWRAAIPLLFGLALLASFVLLRVARFSHFVQLLGWTWLDSRVTSLLELSAIAFIALGARLVIRS